MYNQKGKLIHKSEIQEGTSAKGNVWQRMQIVIEISSTSSEFKNYMAFEVGMRNIVEVDEIPIGSIIDVGFFVNSREWQGRWFTNADLFSVEVMSKQTKSEPINLGNTEPQSDDLPFD